MNLMSKILPYTIWYFQFVEQHLWMQTKTAILGKEANYRFCKYRTMATCKTKSW